jgi:hypothetical protein
MSHKHVVAKISMPEAMTVERGASPAEATTAATLARRLISQLTRRNYSDTTADAIRRSALAPGVHVTIVANSFAQR